MTPSAPPQGTPASTDPAAIARYFEAMARALAGLDTYLALPGGPAEGHELLGGVIAEYLDRLEASFGAWRDRAAFAERFALARAESGFPLFQNVLELERDQREAKSRLEAMPGEEALRESLLDAILTRHEVPVAPREQIAQRRYLESVSGGRLFTPLVLARTVRVSVNPNTKRPYYLVHWGVYDGSAHLPLIYVALIEDSTRDMVDTLVTGDGKLNASVEIPLPVEGLLNPALARPFDEFTRANSPYGLTLATIVTGMDKDFPTLHPKQLRRFVLGPFYHADITVHGKVVDQILATVSRPQDRWMLTWTEQEIHSIAEKPGKWSLWGSEPARDEYFIDTNDLDCVQMGCSAFSRHALVPHEAYQAIFAAGEQARVFDGYKVHILSGKEVLRSV